MKHRFMRHAGALAGASVLSACAALGTPAPGLTGGRLADCPSAPHCVSSQAKDADHRVEPFALRDGDRGWTRVIEAVRASERTTIVASDDQYLHAEVLSPWHFYTDDLELLRSGDRVEVRSSSRVGYYDFHVNRKRIEALRATLVNAGAIAR